MNLVGALFANGLLIATGVAAAADTGSFLPRATWDWQLTEPLDLSRTANVLDLHPDLVSPADLAELKARGLKTICYVSVGTLEKTASDLEDFPKAVIGKVYGDWPDERFLDIRRRDVLVPLMRKRFQRCKALGFDAIEPDNMDVHANDSGFDISADDTVAYVRGLAEEAHRMGLAIGQKNVPELTGAFIDVLDFAITESCFQDGWCDDVLPYARAGKAIFSAEYIDRPLDMAAACAYAARHGLSLIAKDRHLTRKYRGCGA